MRIARILTALAVLALPGPAAADTERAASRARAGDHDATAEVACAQEVGQLPGRCAAAVARAGDAAAVVVTFPNGFARTLTFAGGAFLRGNPTMSGTGTDTDWHRAGGYFHVRVDDQRFEISEGLVLGEPAAPREARPQVSGPVIGRRDQAP